MKNTTPLQAHNIPYRRSRSAMTLLEVFVVTVVLAILVAVCLPVFSTVSVKGVQTKALSNAKQIGLALRLYASDHDGVYPSYTLQSGKPTTVTVPDSNTAFAQLFPTYVTWEEIFWQNKSKFCSLRPPDGIIDNPALDVPVDTLKRGENEWAFVPGLTDGKSDPMMPLVANGFADPVLHTYSSNENRKGGVWKGLSAVVIHEDTSGALMKVNQATMTVTGPNGTGGSTGDIFTTANSANGWLTPANAVVNPK